jgi:hypothetical protein
VPVAKSYQKLQVVGEPYIKNNKTYIIVQQDSGTRKEVRWYTDAEYAKLYPEEEHKPSRLRSVRDVLGFKEGYITLFKGDTYPLLDWFHTSNCRYHNFWGWYVVSEESLPDPIPAGLEPVRLMWDSISISDKDCLKPEEEVRTVVNNLIFGESASQHIGAIGERLDFSLTLVKAIKLEDGFYGPKMFYIFHDENDNQFVWSTTPRELEEGKSYGVRGTVKAHSIYKNIKQTELTRCMIK